MCKSKSEGGQRCAAHLRASVTQSVTTYATATTTLSRAKVLDVAADLEREGDTLPDPSREEVDQWLEQTIQQVEHEPDLNETRRSRILTHLKAAIGRVLPSGATFHMWKNLFAEAWQRSRRASTIFFAAGIITVTGGCGIGQTSAEPNPPIPSVAAEVADDAIPAPFIPYEVKKQYGEADALAAYQMGAQFIIDFQTDDRFLHLSTDTATVDKFADAQQYLTKVRQKDFAHHLECDDTNSDCYENAAALIFYGVNGQSGMHLKNPDTGKLDPATVRTDVRSVDGKRIKSANMFADEKRLAVEIKSISTMRVETKTGQQGSFPINGDTTLWFKKVDGEWKIDGWSGKMSGKK